MRPLVVDSSALLAILLGEPEASHMVATIQAAAHVMIGAPTLVEAAAVLSARRGKNAAIAVDALLQALGIDVVPMTAEAGAHARAAWLAHGKGVGSPGVLNFGDCLALGVAQSLDADLLYKGGDFTKAGIPPAS